MSVGNLRVTVVEGRNLRDEDAVGQNDAFIELYFDKKYKQRTTTIKDNNSPTWNETFTFNLQKDDDTLRVKVYDDDVAGKDAVGSTRITLKQIKEAGGQWDNWFKLPGPLGIGSNGEVHLILHLS